MQSNSSEQHNQSLADGQMGMHNKHQDLKEHFLSLNMVFKGFFYSRKLNY